jgi:hypothetical protein
MDYLGLYKQYIELGSLKSDGFTSCKCPFHPDTNKSAGVNLKNGVFHCFPCSISYSATKFISLLSGKSMPEAMVIVDSFRNANGIAAPESNFSNKFIYAQEKPEWRDMYMKSRRASLRDTFAVDYCKEKGFDISTLEFNNVGFLEAKDTPEKWGRDSIVIPYFYNDQIVGLRFRDCEGKKSGLEKSLYLPLGLDNIPVDCKVAIAVEGESDYFKLMFEFNKRGINIPIIATPGTSYQCEWERDLSNIDLFVIIPDSDSAGSEMVKNWEKNHKGSFVQLNLEWKRRQLGKDLCDWFAQNSDNGDELIDKIQSIISSTYTSNELQDTDDFLVEHEDDDHLIEYVSHFLNSGQIGIIGGAQKSKKTWIALNLVRSLLTPGDNFLGMSEFTSTKALPNVMYVQTEGSKKKFQDRITKVFNGCDNRGKAKWSFKPGYKLDNPKDVKKIKKVIIENDIGVLILDPFQRLHNVNEDSSTETAPVWDALFDILNCYPKLCILIIHHFGKEGNITEKWKALRGSSRAGGEADFGLFVANDSSKDYDGVKVTFDFRDEDKLVNEDGSGIFKVAFNPDSGVLARITDSEPKVVANITEALEEYIKKNGQSKFMDLIKHFGVSEPTLTKYVEKSKILEKTKPAIGQPVCVKLVTKK